MDIKQSTADTVVISIEVFTKIVNVMPLGQDLVFFGEVGTVIIIR